MTIDNPGRSRAVGPDAGAPRDDELIEASVSMAADLLRAGETRSKRRERRRRARLARLLSSEAGSRFVFSLADRVLRPQSSRAAAAQLRLVARDPLSGLSRLDRALLRAGALVARLAPRPVVALVTARLRFETRALVFPAERRPLSGRLARVWSGGERPNVNLLGEAVLGWEEAERRAGALDGLLRRTDVDCVSVKVSSVSTGLSLLDLDGSVRRVVGPLAALYRAAMTSEPPKLVNLDMEEHRDLDVTVETFVRLLSEPEFASLTAGIALQAYLPDTHAALDRLLGWAEERRQAGGAPVRIRLVKGANLAMESVEAELREWPSPVYATKAETDASYVALLERLISAVASGGVQVGVASHNLFDVALALVLAERAGVAVDIEMLAGMADAQASAVRERTGRVLLYVPVTSRRDFRRNALAYLARRLDENATPQGFLRHALDMTPGNEAWEDQARQFAAAVRARHRVRTVPRHEQDRTQRASRSASLEGDGRWCNEPDTDLTVAENRTWARGVLSRRPHRAISPATTADVEAAVALGVVAAAQWRTAGGAQRRAALEDAADALAAGRAEAIAVMAADAGKVFSEADTEVSEAVDYARYYARGIELIDEVAPTVESTPLGLVVVAPPWNFPYAIPAGGVLAALAAGNAVILKPSPDAVSVSAVLSDQLVGAGLGAGTLGFVPAPDDDAGRLLVTHPEIGGVVLTGSIDTAALFARWAPGRRLLAETSGKNAIVVGATADVDQAVSDLVRSAFGHAGQKCSAASLAIVDASLYDRSTFLRQLRDATSSLRVGPATDPATEVGPIVGPFTPALERALTALDPGESWLVEPRLVDPETRLWSPGVRLGVRPGSWAHTTEWFGPMLAVMRAPDLATAIGIQNQVRFGLTAGLQSLDPDEHDAWADAVEAGNLYVNRHTTGAIVGRQPFGGWKASSVGPTAKTGGPNTLIGLRRWSDREHVSVEEARRSYESWWGDYFSRSHELAGLRSESNVLRYRPSHPGVVVRAGPDAPIDQIAKAAAVAALVGTPVAVSAARDDPLFASLRHDGIPVVVESAASLGAGAAGLGGRRLRLLGAAEPEVLAAAAEHTISVLDEPVCSHGRIELVRWLREQVVSRSLHRYGNVVYDR